MNKTTFIALAAALSWAPLDALVQLARPMPVFQVAGLALFLAFLVVRMVNFIGGVCAVRPWRTPAAVLGLGALAAWGLHLSLESSIWLAPASAWVAIVALALGPLCLSVWAWQAGQRTWVFALAGVCVLLGRLWI
ncbi:MAG TPA: hypothetical protein VIN35_15495 [Hydrogenophaga sp.]